FLAPPKDRARIVSESGPARSPRHITYCGLTSFDWSGGNAGRHRGGLIGLDLHRGQDLLPLTEALPVVDGQRVSRGFGYAHHELVAGAAGIAMVVASVELLGSGFDLGELDAAQADLHRDGLVAGGNRREVAGLFQVRIGKLAALFRSQVLVEVHGEERG